MARAGRCWHGSSAESWARSCCRWGRCQTTTPAMPDQGRQHSAGGRESCLLQCTEPTSAIFCCFLGGFLFDNGAGASVFLLADCCSRANAPSRFIFGACKRTSYPTLDPGSALCLTYEHNEGLDKRCARFDFGRSHVQRPFSRKFCRHKYRSVSKCAYFETLQLELQVYPSAICSSIQVDNVSCATSCTMRCRTILQIQGSLHPAKCT